MANLHNSKAGSPEKLLVLVIWSASDALQDFLGVSREIVRQASDICVHIANPLDTAATVPPERWKLPTLVIGFTKLGNFSPLRGRILSCRPVKKLDQYTQFKACGINTPLTEKFKFGVRYNEATWGEFCTLKPLPLTKTSKGDIQLVRTRRLHQIQPSDFPPDHFLRQAPVLVQQFIDTGKNPSYWRVMTLFGEPLYWWRGFSPLGRPDLSASDAEIESAIIEPKHPLVKEKFQVSDRRDLNVDQEFLDFATQMDAAFPNLPLKGNDILREIGTGKLYAIEINGGGNVWHFSSPIFRRSRKQMGGRDAMIKHYDPWPAAARALIAKTRALAI